METLTRFTPFSATKDQVPGVMKWRATAKRNLHPIVSIRNCIRNQPTSAIQQEIDFVQLGDVYLNGLSVLKEIEFTNRSDYKISLKFLVEHRKPNTRAFAAFQLENENLQYYKAATSPNPSSSHWDDEYWYNDDGFNELFNQIGHIDHIELLPKQSQRVTLCYRAVKDALTIGSGEPLENETIKSDEERFRPAELSAVAIKSRIIVCIESEDPELNSIAEAVLPLRGIMCRSVFRVDTDDLLFGDCVPGGSYVKDFAVWNQSEIPLVFRISSMTNAFDPKNELLQVSKYDSGQNLFLSPCVVAAYSHTRVRVTFRPRKIGERMYFLNIENLHDTRNMKQVKVFTNTNQERHREGLVIRADDGLEFSSTSNSVLSFGDCYNGIRTSRVLHIKNTTTENVHVELSSDRPKEVSFELKQHRQMVQDLQREAKRLGQEVGNASKFTAFAEFVDIDEKSDDGRTGTSVSGSSASTSNLGFSFPSLNLENVVGYLSTQLVNQYSDSPQRAMETKSNFSGGQLDDVASNDSEEEGVENDDKFLRSASKSMNELDEQDLEEYLEDLGDVDNEDDDFEFDRDRPRNTRVPKPNGLEMSAQEQRTLSPSLRSSREDLLQLERASQISGSSIPLEKETDSLMAMPLSTSNYLVDTLRLTPGSERAILVWYCRPLVDKTRGDQLQEIDAREGRLAKQSFRLSFRCYQIRGSWHDKVLDRSLGKTIQARARTCTSIVNVSPSTVNFGDCNIGEQKSMTVRVLNLSDLPTSVSANINSKVVSCTPNDHIELQPKQHRNLRIEIIPRKNSARYTKTIVVKNDKNARNTVKLTVQSNNMDAHHVIYHSLFYKLKTNVKRAYLKMDYAVVNSPAFNMFSLTNITKNHLTLKVKSSDTMRLTLYRYVNSKEKTSGGFNYSSAGTSCDVTPCDSPGNPGVANENDNDDMAIRRRMAWTNARLELGKVYDKKSDTPRSAKRKGSSRGLIFPKQQSKRRGSACFKRSRSFTDIQSLHKEMEQSFSDGMENTSGTRGTSQERPVKQEGSATPPGVVRKEISSHEDHIVVSEPRDIDPRELGNWFNEFPRVASEEDEEAAVKRFLTRRTQLEELVTLGKLVPLHHTDNNVEMGPKNEVFIVAMLVPLSDLTVNENDRKRTEKYKVFISFPETEQLHQVTHAIGADVERDRYSVRELLISARVSRSFMSVNQKNINFGRMITSAVSSKVVTIRNSSCVPLLYQVAKTGSIASGFLRITEGQVGIIRPFKSKDLRFELRPALAGKFEEKLNIINLQDADNSVAVTIKAKVVRPETFKLIDAEQPVCFGSCLIGKAIVPRKLLIRNTSKTRRRYVIQIQPSESNHPAFAPSFTFEVDEASTISLTPDQEQKLDEELEKLEHKLRIAITKHKTDKIAKLRGKITKVKEQLNGTIAEDQQNSTALTSIRTPNSLNFELSGDSIARVVVSCIVRLKEGVVEPAEVFGLDGIAPLPFEIRGHFAVYEMKNEDIIKTFNYQLLVFLRTNAGRQQYYLEVGQPASPMIASIKRDMLPISPLGLGAVEGFEEWSEVAEKSNSIVDALPCDLRPTEIDMGEESVGTTTHSRLWLENLSAERIPYELFVNELPTKGAFLHPSQETTIAFDSPTGILESQETIEIPFSIHVNDPGRYTRTIGLRHAVTKVELDTRVSVSLSAVRPVYVRIPELDPHATGKPNALNFGYCYDVPSDPSHSTKTKKLVIESQVDQRLLLSARSNLKKQCYVYRDKDQLHDAHDIILEGQGSTELFLVFKPRLPGGSECREIIGGIQISLLECSDELAAGGLVATFTIVFSGIAGRSIAQVSPAKIPLGCFNASMLPVRQNCHFTIYNVSKQLPLQYRLHAEKSRQYSDDEQALSLDFGDEYGKIDPGKSANIVVEGIISKAGLFRRSICVENLTCAGQSFEILVEVFVDKNVLEYLPSLIGSAPESSAAVEEPVVDLGCVAIVDFIENKAKVGLLDEAARDLSSLRTFRTFAAQDDKLIVAPGHFCDPFGIKNRTDEPLLLRLISNLQLAYSWQSSLEQVEGSSVESLIETPDSNRELYFMGKPFQVDPRDVVYFRIGYRNWTSTPPLLREQVNVGKLVKFDGVLVIQELKMQEKRITDKSMVKLVRFSGNFCQSCIQVNREEIDLGRVGYVTGYTPVHFTISLKNISQLATRFFFPNLPSEIQMVRVRAGNRVRRECLESESGPPVYSRKTGVPSLSKLVAAEMKSSPIFLLKECEEVLVEFVYSPQRKSAASGAQDYAIRVLNSTNPHNKTQVHVSANVISSLVRIEAEETHAQVIEGTERVEDAAQDAVTAYLPPVIVPPPAARHELDCNCVFVITNIYDQEIEVKLKSFVEEFGRDIYEFSILWRTSNTVVESFRLLPEEVAELRIVCSVISSARLPSETLESTDAPEQLQVRKAVPKMPKLLGKVQIVFAASPSEGTFSSIWCQEEIDIRGKLEPGSTFSVSASSLHFYASRRSPTAEDSGQVNIETSEKSLGAIMDNDGESFTLQTEQDAFHIHNTSSTQTLDFVINPHTMLQKGLRLKDSNGDLIHDYIVPVPTPTEGSIAPGKSILILVHLESDESRYAGKTRGSRSRSWGQEYAASGENEAIDADVMSLVVTDLNKAGSLNRYSSTTVEVRLILQNLEDDQSHHLASPDDSKTPRKRRPSSRIEKGRALQMNPNVLYRGSDERPWDEGPKNETTKSSREGRNDGQYADTPRTSNSCDEAILGVRGCTPVDESDMEETRYVVDVGQHSILSGGEIEWEITLESLNPNYTSGIGYRIYFAQDIGLVHWIELSRDRGVVDYMSGCQSIVLRFLRSAVGCYSTFLIVENQINPRDMKLILVKLEIIADLKSFQELCCDDRVTSAFSILVPGNHKNRRHQLSPLKSSVGGAGVDPSYDPFASNRFHRLNFGEIYYNHLYRSHSIILVNASNVALDFSLATNARRSELQFSLSTTTLKEATNVTIAAQSRLQVFFYFTPQPPGETEQTLGAPREDGLDKPWKREIEIYVGCRLVKDYRETILMQCECYHPQLKVDKVFAPSQVGKMLSVGSKSKRNSVLLVEDDSFLCFMFVTSGAKEDAVPYQFVEVSNTKSRTCSFILKNRTQFFHLRVLKNSLEEEVYSLMHAKEPDEHEMDKRRNSFQVHLDPFESIVLVIEPNVESFSNSAIRKHYVEEHVTLYNVLQYTEHYHVTLRLTKRDYTRFYSSPSYQVAYSYSKLEDAIGRFLLGFNCLWKSVDQAYGEGKHFWNDSLSGAELSTCDGIKEMLHRFQIAIDLARNTELQFLPNEDETPVDAYHRLFFDLFCITDELVWYAVRSKVSRTAFTLADLVYSVVFKHEIFTAFLPTSVEESPNSMPRMLKPWIQQLGHFLSYFPKRLQAIASLRKLYGRLEKSVHAAKDPNRKG